MAAGGDGTQALVATIAAEHDLPFACIPAGTRNHFALDLGVDRNDVVGALDAFVDGGEKRVDLGEVSGRTFVNNVSLGLYAEAVQSDGYRDAKIRTILDTVPTMLAHDSAHESTRELRWTGPDGRAERSAAVILVSNNVYRLGRSARLRHSAAHGRRRARRDGRRRCRPGREPPERQERVGHARSSSSSPTATSRSASTARRWSCRRRSCSGPGRASSASASRRHHPGASPSAAQPDGTARCRCDDWPASPRERTRSTPAGRGRR